MYRTSDPRFRRRINDLSATVETATEQAQSGLYIFGERYVQPCLSSFSSCFASCVDASCPALNFSQRDRLRRQRGRGGGRGARGADLGFEFYDDWDDLDESDNLLGWGGNDEFDRLLSTGGTTYGAVTTQQPGRQGAMSYPKARRKSVEPDPALIPSSRGFFGRMFGGKAVRYKPSAADLQEHPGARGSRRAITEGEALLEESEGGSELDRRHRRGRSGTATSGETTSSLSSRGDIFPSDEELDDAIPLDDEFAMVLERRNTQSGPESTESSSNRTGKERRGKRPSAGSRTSTRRTFSSRSTPSSRRARSRQNNSEPQTPVRTTEQETREQEDEISTLVEFRHEEASLAHDEEAKVQLKRKEAQKLAAGRGLQSGTSEDELPNKEGTPRAASPVTEPTTSIEEPSQLPTPLSTDDEEDEQARQLSDIQRHSGDDGKPAS